MLYPLIAAGVKSKLLQIAYHKERETRVDTAIVECLQDQVEYGKELLRYLDESDKLPTPE